MKIVLLGYMGSGKSYIGKKLAKKLAVPFIDLDAFIEKKEQATIPTIFKEKGEIYFRLIENKYLKEVLNIESKFVLSLGGGTPCYAGNMEVILKNKKTTSIYLQTRIKTLVERLENGKEKRPLVKELSNEKLVEFVAKHLFERSFFYEQAQEKISTNNKVIEEILTEIRILLH